MLAAVMMLPLASVAQSLPFSETFDGTTIPTGWTQQSGLADQVFAGTALTSGTQWNFGNNNGLPDNHARINIYGPSRKGWLITPSISLAGVSTAQLSFDLAYTAYSGTLAQPAQTGVDDKFMVIVSTDDGATWSAANATVWLHPDNADYASANYSILDIPYTDYQTVVINLTAYVGNTVKIAFYGESTTNNADNNMHIDNVLVEEIPSCARVTAIVASEITSEGMTLSWTDATNTGATYTVYNMADTSVLSTGVSGYSCTLTGLAANTLYTFGVVAHCNATDASSFKTVSARTACGALTSLPYTMGFEEADLVGTSSSMDKFPMCWTRINNSTSSSYNYYPYSNNSSSYVYNGSRYLQFTGGTSTSYPDTQVAVLPQLDVTLYPMNLNRVTFWARSSSASYDKVVYVGTLADPADFTTFTLVDSVVVTGITYALYSVALATAPATDAYVALAAKKATGTLYLDDLTLEEMPACMEIANLALVADMTTTNSLTISWEDVNNPTGTTYTVYDMADTSVIATALTATTYTITDLTANTGYTFGVAANCSMGDAALMTVSGRTACAAIAELPYTMGFEEEDLQGTTNVERLPWCWSRINNSTSTSYNYYPYSYYYATNAYDGRYMYFTGGTSATYPDTQALVLPQLDVTLYPMNANRVSFWARSSSASYDKVVYVGTLTNPADYNTFTLADSVVVSGTEYVKYTVLLSAAPATDAYLAIAVKKASGNVYLDNLTLEVAPSCVEVSDVTVVSVTNNSVTLSWNDETNAEGTTYSVYNMTASTEVPVSTGITGTTVTVSDLTANTEYTFGVMANCSATDLSTVETVTARTACNAVALPLIETFAATSNTRDCWNLVSNNTVNASSLITSSNYFGFLNYVSSGDTIPVLVFNSWSSATDYFQYAYSPLLDATAMADYDMINVRVRFSTHGAADPIRLGYTTLASTNPEDYTWTDDYSTTGYNDWQEININVPLNTTRIALNYTSVGCNYKVYVDTVALTGYTLPACPAVTDLAVSNITSSGATLTWEGTADSYIVFPQGNPDYALMPTTTEVGLTSLNANTEYTYAVVANCGASTSDTVYVTFRTACDAMTLPFTETFDATSTTRDCWNFISMNTGNDLGTNNGMGYFTVNDHEVWRFSSYSNHGGSGDYNQYGYSPELAVSADATLLNVSVTYATYGATDMLYFGYISGFDTVWDPTAYTTTGSSDWQTYTAVIPATATKLAINYFGDYKYYAWIDSVSVTEMTGTYCWSVADLTVDSVTASSVFLSWSDEDNSGATYTVYGADGTVIASNLTATSYEVTGLAALSSYTFGVAANCTADATSDVVIISATTACANEGCTITIAAQDSWGDGWNGNTINVLQNGTVVASYSMEDMGLSNVAAYDTAYLSICAGMPVSLSWVAGSYPNETSFEVFDANGNSVYTAGGSSMVNDSIFFTAEDLCAASTPELDSIAVVAMASYPTHGSVTLNAEGVLPVYHVGDTVIATATPDSDYLFSYWAIAFITDDSIYNYDTIYTNPFVLPVDENVVSLGQLLALSAEFEAISGVADSLTITLATANATMGTTNPVPGTYRLGEGDTLAFSAVPSDGYHLLYWISELQSTSDGPVYTDTLYGESYTVSAIAWLLQASYIVTAYFEADAIGADSVQVTLAVNDATMGTITPAPGVYYYAEGETIEVDATAAAGYNFVGWVESYSYGGYTWSDTSYTTVGHFEYEVEDYDLDLEDWTIMALFSADSIITPEPDSLVIITAVNDATMGTVSPAPGTHVYYAGDTFSVYATPNAGYHLESWTVTITGYGGSNTYTYPGMLEIFTLDTADHYLGATMSFTANFAAGEAPELHDSLTVITSVNDATMGTVLPAPGTHYYVAGDTVIFSVLPNDGYVVSSVYFSMTFPQYGVTFDTTLTESVDAFIDSLTSQILLVTENDLGLIINLGVTFAPAGVTPPAEYTVTVNYDATRGSVSSNGEPVANGSVITVVENGSISFTAAAYTNYEFVAWVDNGDTVGRQTIYTLNNVNENHTVTAVFATPTTGIGDVDMENVNIYSTDNVIVVRGAEGKQVVLFDVNGRVLSREASAAESVEFRVATSGVYMVKVADAAAKRVVVLR